MIMNVKTYIQPISYRVNKYCNHSYQPKPPITITNFHYVDETLMRGAKPTQAQLQELKDNGVKTIISFCTNYNQQNPKTKVFPDEANWANKLGIDFYWMPFRSAENPLKQDIDTFFKVTDEARQNGERVFIHCRHGADRTGVFSAMYRLRNQNIKLSDVIRELMKYGHDANHNPNIIPFLIDYYAELNPINKFKTIIKELIRRI